VSGFLTKQPEAGLFKGSAQSRYFVLEAGFISYYKSRELFQAGGKPIKNQRIGMSDHSVLAPEAGATDGGKDGDELTIVLQPVPGTTASRTWVLSAPNAEDRVMWVEAMQKHGAVVQALGEDEDGEAAAGGGGVAVAEGEGEGDVAKGGEEAS